MADDDGDAGRGGATRDFMHRVLLDVRRTMAGTYGLREVAIKAVGSGGARLSIPVRITGVRGEGEPVRLFGKIMGPSDVMSSHSMQLAKNVWLRMNGGLPLFGLYGSVEEMAREQYEGMLAIHSIGVPTALPHGYHRLAGGMWLLVLEFIDARPIAELGRLDQRQVDVAFRHLRRMHRDGIHHGDIKPDNIMVDDEVRILDIGRYDGSAAVARRQSYDLASMVCAFAGRHPAEGVVGAALKHHGRRRVRAAAQYVELVHRRPDFDFDDGTRDRLMGLMTERGSARSLRRRARRAEAKRPSQRRGRLRLRRAPK